MSHISRLAACGAALALGACANGYSPSLAQAPLVLTEARGDDLVIRRLEDATGDAVRLQGDFRSGVDGYAVVGGNALLPTIQPVLQPAVSAPLPSLEAQALNLDVTAGPAEVALGVGAVNLVSADLRLGGGAAAASAGLAGAALSVETNAAQTLGAQTLGAQTVGAVAGLAPAVTTIAPNLSAAAQDTIAAVASVTAPAQALVDRSLATNGPLLETTTAVAGAAQPAVGLPAELINGLLAHLRSKP